LSAGGQEGVAGAARSGRLAGVGVGVAAPRQADAVVGQLEAAGAAQVVQFGRVAVVGRRQLVLQQLLGHVLRRGTRKT